MRWLVGTLFLTACGTVVALQVLAWVLPVPSAISRPLPSTRVLDRDGALLHETLSPGNTRGGVVALKDLSPHLVNATLAGEDHRFRSHGGVDGWAVLRATWLNVKAGRLAFGGSTLTQQLARLCQPGARTWAHKLRLAFSAYVLEAHLTKDEILAQYLGRAPYGGNLVGAAAAARAYFGKPPSQLSLAEASLLAVIPRAPVRYHPRQHLDAALERRAHVLDLMVERGFITAEDRSAALAEALSIQPEAWPLRAPHAVVRVLGEAEAGEAEIRTTLDAAMQERVENLVATTVKDLGGRGVTQAAVLVVEIPGGQVRAYVGSADFSQPREGQVDGTQAPRSPGSALKPLVYGTALSRGFTPASLLLDIERPFAASEGQFLPHNFDQRQHGPVLLRDALGNSYNLAAVDLAQRLGLPVVLETLHRFGLHPASTQDLGLGVVLGGVDVTLWEVAQAYLALGRGGTAVPLTLREDRAPSPPTRVLDAVSTALLTNILADDAARARSFGRRSVLQLPFEAAVKTGTSKDFRDNWAVGYSTRFLTAVWAGDFSGRSMTGVSGVTGAGILWHRVMRAIHPTDPPAFVLPPGVESAPVCALSGQQAGPHCPTRRQELFARATSPNVACLFHPAPGVLSLPPELREWADHAGLPAQSQGSVVRVTFPRPGQVFTLDALRAGAGSGLFLSASGPEGGEVRLELDGRERGRGQGQVRVGWQAQPGRHELRATTTEAQSSTVGFEVRP